MLCSEMSSLPKTVKMVAVPFELAFFSSGISPVTRRQMSLRSPSLPAEYMGAPGGLTARPVRRGSARCQLGITAALERLVHTTMGSFGRPKDGRLARLPHIRGLCLSGKQQRVRVSICVAGYNPADEG